MRVEDEGRERLGEGEKRWAALCKGRPTPPSSSPTDQPSDPTCSRRYQLLGRHHKCTARPCPYALLQSRVDTPSHVAHALVSSPPHTSMLICPNVQLARILYHNAQLYVPTDERLASLATRYASTPSCTERTLRSARRHGRPTSTWRWRILLCTDGLIHTQDQASSLGRTSNALILISAGSHTNLSMLFEMPSVDMSTPSHVCPFACCMRS